MCFKEGEKNQDGLTTIIRQTNRDSLKTNVL